MPELPDVTVSVEALRKRVVGCALRGIRLGNASVLRKDWPKTIDELQG